LNHRPEGTSILTRRCHNPESHLVLRAAARKFIETSYAAAEGWPVILSILASLFAPVQKWFMRRYVRAFERSNNYDMSYVHAMLESDPNAVLVLNRVGQMANYVGPLPQAVAHCVGLVATLHEDCGPCLQLGVTLALRARISHDTIARVLSGEPTGDDDVDLAISFCGAVLRDAANVSELRDQVVARFGHDGLTAMAFSLTGHRMYPMLKRVLGYAHCYPVVKVGERSVRLATHVASASSA
jgi:hypothetical protein